MISVIVLSSEAWRTIELSKSKSKEFKSFSVVHVDWRWEVLAKVLGKVLPIFEPLKKNWNEKLMVTGDSGVLDVALFREATSVLNTANFIELGELIRLTGKNLEIHAHKLETCHCHGHIYMKDMSWKRKQYQMIAETGRDTCAWKGRTGGWWVAEALDQMLSSVNNCTTEDFQNMLTNLPSAQRVTLLSCSLIYDSRCGKNSTRSSCLKDIYHTGC